jgi:5-hydroxyisourate hydrolase-like protein (transthyretin family)
MSLTFVQGDTAPAITAQIVKETDGTAVNLSGAAVRFQMRKEDDRRFTVNAIATVVAATEGQVSYDWAANDLATPGEYQVQWEVTYADSRVQTTAVGTVTVRRQ